jgi:mitochondrial chaperone BCS1
MFVTSSWSLDIFVQWYADRGIPFRRGYLLHGVPGSGKSSLIHALAGEIGLDIYTLSLSSSWISDATLTALMGRVPARCIVLLEDLDAAFTRSTQRDGKDTGTPAENEQERDNQQQQQQQSSSSNSRSSRRNRDFIADMNTLSLSGLLNALDGVAASEGRLLFATTNHLERLDPALSRPGRMDVWIEFKNASKWQAEALFRNFFPSVEERDAALLIDKDDITLDAGELAGIRLPSPPPQSSSSSGASSLWNISSPFSSSTSSLVSWPGAAAGSGSSPSSSPHPEKGSHRGRSKEKDTFGAMNQAYMPPPVEEHIASLSHSARPLDSQTLARLAKQFADSIPEDEFSVAALQGCEYIDCRHYSMTVVDIFTPELCSSCNFSLLPFLNDPCTDNRLRYTDLLKNKSQPEAAAKDAAAWVVNERELRERLQREKEAKEEKEKEEVRKRASK